eukprot:1180716-Prorocentrum_minimum.AAC.3
MPCKDSENDSQGGRPIGPGAAGPGEQGHAAGGSRGGGPSGGDGGGDAGSRRRGTRGRHHPDRQAAAGKRLRAGLRPRRRPPRGEQVRKGV